MNVYIEYVIIDNLIIDYLLLKATLYTTNINTSKGKVHKGCLLGGLIGVAVALIVPLLQSVKVIGTLVKICTGLLMVVVACGKQNLKTYLYNFGVFFGYTFACGGAIYGIFTILGIDYSTEISVALMFLPVGLILWQLKKLITFIYQKRTVIQSVYQTDLILNGTTVSVKGLMDTGNGLLDNGNPVIICGKNTAQKFFGVGKSLPKMGRIEVNTINGTNTMPTIKLDKLILYIAGEKRIFNSVTMCVAKTWGAIGYDAILHPLLMEGENVKRTA